MASTHACINSARLITALQQRKTAIRALAPSTSLGPPFPSAAHAHRACFPQQPRRLAACRARDPSSDDAGADAPGASSQPSPTTNAPAPWATVAVLSPFFSAFCSP